MQFQLRVPEIGSRDQPRPTRRETSGNIAASGPSTAWRPRHRPLGSRLAHGRARLVRAAEPDFQLILSEILPCDRPSAQEAPPDAPAVAQTKRHS